MEQLDDIKTELGAPGDAVWRDFDLVVVSGPAQGSRLRVDPTTPRRTVGTSRACDLVVVDPKASRRHFAAESTPQGLVITDLTSTNGTFLNGVRVLSAFAASNDRIRFGSTELRVEMVKTNEAPKAPRDRFGRIVGTSEVMQRLYPIFDRLVASDAPIVIEGPGGTGKELLAETLHELGSRKAGPFVVFDCATARSGSMAARLFGDASSGTKGAWDQARGGTLYITEIADLDGEGQVQLHRALERESDVRVIASTRRDLEVAVQSGRFREDLYFKLAALRVELPPLRARRGDVERLAHHFWTELGGRGRLSEEAVRRLAQADWLGNVAELRSAIARMVALGETDVPQRAEATETRAPSEPPPGNVNPFESVLAENLAFPVARQRVMDAFDRLYVQRALERAGGNASAAAAASGIARRYFYTIKKRSS